jgi:hypoxanthine phosphoribosyltransferase
VTRSFPAAAAGGSTSRLNPLYSRAKDVSTKLNHSSKTIVEKSTLVAPVRLGGDTFEVYLSKEKIAARIQEMGAQIEKDYAGKKPIMIGILNGAFIFTADLFRSIQTIDIEIDFYKLSSYGDEKISSGKVKLRKPIDADLNGRDVIIVEDVVDSGLSMTYIRNAVLELEPKSLRFCTLLYKSEVAKLDFTIDYIGFDIPKEFVIGYGLDYKQLKRNLPEIYRLTHSE